DEHGYISREFHRRYRVPSTVNPAAISSALSTEGLLSIQAPVTESTKPEERSVPITRKEKHTPLQSPGTHLQHGVNCIN
ncbi:hypothetical protein FKM82_013141, partial [Ascaphus truei]